MTALIAPMRKLPTTLNSMIKKTGTWNAEST